MPPILSSFGSGAARTYGLIKTRSLSAAAVSNTTTIVVQRFTSSVGWIAPVGVEFGLLYAAFRRRYALHSDEAIPWTLWTLEVLLFLTQNR